MIEIKRFNELYGVIMPQNVSFVFQVRNPFVRRSIKKLTAAKVSRFSCLPRGNGFIPTAVIWLQIKEILKEKKSYGSPINGRNHESPGRNNVLFAEMKFSPVQMIYVPVQMMCVPVQMKFSPVQMTYAPAQMKFSPVQMTYVPVQMMFAPVQMTYAPVGGD